MLILVAGSACRQAGEPAADNGANAPQSAGIEPELAPSGLGNADSPPAPADNQADGADGRDNEIDESEDHGSEAGPPPPPPGTIYIPAAFQGRWGTNATDCTAPRGRENMAMTVTSERLEFYESNGRLQRTIGSYPERFIGDFAYIGEGETWRRREQLVLSESSNTLVRTSDGRRIRYRRCDRPRV